MRNTSQDKRVAGDGRHSARRQRMHDANREEILDAARSLVLEQGMQGFSLREVARRADYSPAALYRYFDSKEALLSEIAMMAIQMLGSCMSAVPAKLPPRERLVQLGDAYLRFARENPEQFTLVFNKMILPETSWRAYANVAWPFTLVIDAVRDGVTQGAFVLPRSLKPEDIAFGVWSLVHGAATLLQAHLASIEDDLTRYVRIACQAQLDAIAVNNERSTR